MLNAFWDPHIGLQRTLNAPRIDLSGPPLDGWWWGSGHKLWLSQGVLWECVCVGGGEPGRRRLEPSRLALWTSRGSVTVGGTAIMHLFATWRRRAETWWFLPGAVRDRPGGVNVARSGIAGRPDHQHGVLMEVACGRVIGATPLSLGSGCWQTLEPRSKVAVWCSHSPPYSPASCNDRPTTFYTGSQMAVPSYLYYVSSSLPGRDPRGAFHGGNWGKPGCYQANSCGRIGSSDSPLTRKPICEQLFHDPLAIKREVRACDSLCQRVRLWRPARPG